MRVIMPHARGADAAKGQVIDTHLQYRLVDGHGTGVGPVHDTFLQSLIVSEEVQGQGAWPLGDIVQRFIDRVVGHYRQDRAEQFLPHDRHGVRHIRDQMRRHAPGAIVDHLVADRFDARALVLRVPQPLPQALIVAFVDDAGVVGVSVDRRIQPPEGRFVGFNKGSDLGSRQQDIIRRHAGLSGVERLGENDPVDDVVQWNIVGHDDGRFAPQFQGHGREIIRGGAHDMLAHRNGSGKQQMVERQGRKSLRDVRLADHDRHAVFVEALPEYLSQ